MQTNGLKEKLQVIPQHPLSIAKQMTGRENLSVDPLNPQSNQHLISSHSNKTESFIKIIRIKEMIAIPRGFDFKQFSLSVAKETYREIV